MNNVNEIFNVIILGASLEGYKLAKNLLNNEKLKTLIVDINFNCLTNKQINEIKSISYVGALDSLTLSNGIYTMIFNKNLIIRSQRIILAYNPKASELICKGKSIPNIYIDTKQFNNDTKLFQALVLVNTDQDVKNITTIAKKFKFVYVCLKNLHLSQNMALNSKIESVKNVAILPKCLPILDFKLNTKGSLQAVTFEMYGEINCNAIFTSENPIPNIPAPLTTYLRLKPNTPLETKDNGESTKIPNLFALGINSNNKEVTPQKLLNTFK